MPIWISVAIAVVGLLLILVGAYMSVADWNRKNPPGEFKTKADSLEGNINALTKFFDAIKGYPPGMQLIGVGLVLLLVGGAFAGVTALGGVAEAAKKT
ncbi:MAG: hypothetical protein JNL93_02600 [Pelomonas sp.]|nr:hypothetical protein [Roseateles sp.]